MDNKKGDQRSPVIPTVQSSRVSELKSMLTMKQDDWLEACKEIDSKDVEITRLTAENDLFRACLGKAEWNILEEHKQLTADNTELRRKIESDYIAQLTMESLLNQVNELTAENEKLCALLIRCQERLDGEDASDELYEDINSALGIKEGF